MSKKFTKKQQILVTKCDWIPVVESGFYQKIQTLMERNVEKNIKDFKIIKCLWKLQINPTHISHVHSNNLLLFVFNNVQIYRTFPDIKSQWNDNLNKKSWTCVHNRAMYLFTWVIIAEICKKHFFFLNKQIQKISWHFLLRNNHFIFRNRQ